VHHGHWLLGLESFKPKTFHQKKEVKYSLPILKSKVALFMKKVVGIRMQVEHGIKKGQGPWAIGQKHKASHNLEAIQKLSIMM
jgi:hypothetical protein